MARLILEEGGEKRRFKLGTGTLSVGSGASCALKLASKDVAELHAELEFTGDTAVLRLKQGVLPAVVRGRSVTGEVTLAEGVPVQLGGALLTIEYDEGGGKLVERRRPDAAGEPARVQHRRRTVRRGVPTWLILLIFAGVSLGAYAFISNTMMQTQGSQFNARAAYWNMRRALEEDADAEAALAIYADEVEPNWNTVSEADRAEFERMRGEARQRLDNSRLLVNNQTGSTYLDTQLKRYEADYIKGKETIPRIRVFLKRCLYFKETWPRHEEIGWVERMEARYQKLASLADPPTFEDLDWEVNTLTWAKPREYREAFALIEGFLKNASPADADLARALLDAKRAEQEEHFEDRIQEVKYHWQAERYGLAIAELASIVMRFSDEQMETQAAEELVSLPEIDEYLRGYKNQQPHHFARLIENPIVRKKCRELGLLQGS